MEQLTKFIDFLASYPSWIKYTVLGLLLTVIILLVVFKPAKNGLSAHWKLRVYNFENLGETVSQKHVGERFSGRVLDQLLKKQLDAKKDNERKPPTSIFQFRGGPPEDLLEAYKQLAPFISISGYIEEEEKGEMFTAYVRVTKVDANVEIEPLLNQSYKLSKNESDWDIISDSIGEEIFGLLLEMPH